MSKEKTSNKKLSHEEKQRIYVRVMAAILLVFMLITLVPSYAFAAEPVTGSEITEEENPIDFEIDENGNIIFQTDESLQVEDGVISKGKNYNIQIVIMVISIVLACAAGYICAKKKIQKQNTADHSDKKQEINTEKAEANSEGEGTDNG